MNLNNAVLNLQYNGIDITITTCDKTLGIHVDNNLTWNNHLNFLSKKLSSIQFNSLFSPGNIFM